MVPKIESLVRRFLTSNSWNHRAFSWTGITSMILKV